mmetsp:Transcript_1426/g.2164  ORF Transcript_1426/g.2164 Transcript_1426/m.2164 type:complete len:97 (-) Transcript_1426:11-301(-)
MSPTNLSPIHSEFRSILSTSGRYLGDVGDFFAQIELSVFFGVEALDFDEGGVVVLVAEAAFVAEDGAVDVKAHWGGVLFGHLFVFYLMIFSSKPQL